MHIYEKYNGRCAYCGREMRPEELQEDNLNNPCCADCKAYKKDNSLDAFRYRLILLQKKIKENPAAELEQRQERMINVYNLKETKKFGFYCEKYDKYADLLEQFKHFDFTQITPEIKNTIRRILRYANSLEVEAPVEVRQAYDMFVQKQKDMDDEIQMHIPDIHSILEEKIKEVPDIVMPVKPIEEIIEENKTKDSQEVFEETLKEALNDQNSWLKDLFDISPKQEQQTNLLTPAFYEKFEELQKQQHQMESDIRRRFFDSSRVISKAERESKEEEQKKSVFANEQYKQEVAQELLDMQFSTLPLTQRQRDALRYAVFALTE